MFGTPQPYLYHPFNPTLAGYYALPRKQAPLFLQNQAVKDVSPQVTSQEEQAFYKKERAALEAHLDAKKRRAAIPKDEILDLSFMQKIGTKIKNLVFLFPKTVLRGLKGADDFTFADTMMMAQFPYYVGGVVLTLSHLIPGNRKEGFRQAVAVGLYMGGILATHLIINGLYRLKYGVDLSMKYRTKGGQIEDVYASVDFPRFDLLTPEHYHKIANKLGIPEHISDRDGAVREQLRYIITTSRTMKLIIGNLVSAIGAGWLARTVKWDMVLKELQKLPQVWQQEKGGLAATARIVGRSIAAPIYDKGGGIMLAALAILLGGLGYIWTRGSISKNYMPMQSGTLEDYIQADPSRPFSTLGRTTTPNKQGGIWS